MGCCQTNLASPNHPVNIDKKIFIDNIKQNHSFNSLSQHSHLSKQKNNNKLISKDNNNRQNKQQQSSQYQYSYHGIGQQQQNLQNSKVSILKIQQNQQQLNQQLNQQNNQQSINKQTQINKQQLVNNKQQEHKNIKSNKKKILHVQIHPQIVDKQNIKDLIQKQFDDFNKQNKLKLISKQKKQGIIFQNYQQLKLSKIQLIQSNNNIQQNNLLQQGLQSSKLLQFSQHNQLISIKQLNYNHNINDKHNHKNHKITSINNVNHNNKLNNSQTYRQLIQLHEQLSTMIILWDRIDNKFKLQPMNINNDQQLQINNDNQLQTNNKNNKFPNNKKQQQIDKQTQNNLLIDKQLQNIWLNNHQQQQQYKNHQQQQQQQNKHNQQTQQNKQKNNYQQQQHNYQLKQSLKLLNQSQKLYQLKNIFILNHQSQQININHNHKQSSKKQSNKQLQNQINNSQQNNCILQNKAIKQKLSKNNSTNLSNNKQNISTQIQPNLHHKINQNQNKPNHTQNKPNHNQNKSNHNQNKSNHNQNKPNHNQNKSNHNQNIFNHNNPTPPTHQDLKLHLSQIKSNKQKQSHINNNHHKQIQQHNEPQQAQSQNLSDDQYSKCQLSNPTRILNQSFLEQFNQQKNIFYFGQQHSLQKWIEHDRKGYQINKQHILNILSKSIHLNNYQQFHLNNLLSVLLSVIDGYKRLTKINLISYRTLTSTSIIMQQSHQNQHKSGFKVLIDGTKRLYPFSQQFTGLTIDNQLERLFKHLYMKDKNPAQLLYNMTGWIPQYIIVDEINSFQGVFQRLNNNFIDGNTIITFSGIHNQSWGLKSINIQTKQIVLYGISPLYNHTKTSTKSQLSTISTIQQFQQKYSWQSFIKLIRSINVNWNPLIYDYIWKSQNIFINSQLNKKDSISLIDSQYISTLSHQYLLKIPPNQQDIELRVFLQTHYLLNATNSSDQSLVVELYDYLGARVQSSCSSIRKIEKNKTVYSDVLIFQASKQRTEYVLVVRPIQISKQIKYTISAYTFFEVGFSDIPIQRVIQQKQIATFLQQSHCGYSINSPHFLNNFYLQLKVPPLQKIKIFVQMPLDSCKFQLNLIANPEGQQNLTRLNLQTILGQIITSDEFQNGKGYLQIQSKYQDYFLMITNQTKCKGQFKIIVQILQKVPKALTVDKINQIQQINAAKDQLLPKMIQCKQKYFYQEPIFNKEFKWAPTNTGPRKRLKSNTHSGYQPFGSFKDFFKNPFIDFKTQKGKKYQFSIISKSYMQAFNLLKYDEDKAEAEPPTLSMSILKLKRPNDSSQKSINNQSSFKIILDDAFYVPFGFGFWTKVMELQQGEYRFVFPKMQKEAGIGHFNVYEIKQ